jgi:hypothetical protein
MQPDIPAEPAAGDPSGWDPLPPPAVRGPERFPPAVDPRSVPSGPPPYPASHPEPFITPATSATDRGHGPAYPASPPPYGQPAYQQQPYQPQPYQQQPYQQQTYQQPYQQQAYQQQAYGRPPEYRRPDVSYPPPARRHRVRFWLTVAAALLGLAGLLASAAGLATQIMPRRFSPAQQRQIMAWETAGRWRTWPAGRIFPPQVSYQLPNVEFGTVYGLTLSARRVGIAPQTTCQAGTDQTLARVLDARGCKALLRATYTDATGTFVMTVGVAVMPGTAPQAASLPGGRGVRPTVKPVPFPRTLAARFGDRQRQLAGAYSRGPYLVLYTAGYTDGRGYDQISLNPYADSEMTSLASGVAQSVGSALGSPPPPPTCPGAPGC